LHDQDTATWTLTGSTLLPEAGIEEGYDRYGRRQPWALNIGGTTVHRVSRGYVPQIGRLEASPSSAPAALASLPSAPMTPSPVILADYSEEFWLRVGGGWRLKARRLLLIVSLANVWCVSQLPVTVDNGCSVPAH